MNGKICIILIEREDMHNTNWDVMIRCIMMGVRHIMIIKMLFIYYSLDVGVNVGGHNSWMMWLRCWFRVCPTFTMFPSSHISWSTGNGQSTSSWHYYLSRDHAWWSTALLSVVKEARPSSTYGDQQTLARPPPPGTISWHYLRDLSIEEAHPSSHIWRSTDINRHHQSASSLLHYLSR